MRMNIATGTVVLKQQLSKHMSCKLVPHTGVFGDSPLRLSIHAVHRAAAVNTPSPRSTTLNHTHTIAHLSLFFNLTWVLVQSIGCCQ